VPAMIVLFTSGLPADTVTSPQTLIWTMAAMAYLPASLLMRGVAMGRIADMVRTKRDLKLAEEGGLARPGEDRRLPDDQDDDL
jgi:hypothetical protein